MNPTYCGQCIENYIECLKDHELYGGKDVECWKTFQKCIDLCVTADKENLAYFSKCYKPCF